MGYHARPMKLVKKSELPRRRRIKPGDTLGYDLPEEPSDPIPIPDILNLEPRVSGDQDAVHELLELAFLGRDDAKGIERAL